MKNSYAMKVTADAGAAYTREVFVLRRCECAEARSSALEFAGRKGCRENTSRVDWCPTPSTQRVLTRPTGVARRQARAASN